MPLCHKQSRRSRDAPIWSWHQLCIGHSKNYLYYIALGEGDDDGANGNKGSANDLAGGKLLTEKEPCAEDDEDHAELVDRGDAGCGADLQGSEVAEPGQAGADAGEDEEDPAPAGDFSQAMVLFETESDSPGEEEDHRGADRGGKVGVDAGDADLGE